MKLLTKLLIWPPERDFISPNRLQQFLNFRKTLCSRTALKKTLINQLFGYISLITQLEGYPSDQRDLKISTNSSQKDTGALSRERDPETWLEEHGNILFKFAVLRVRDPYVAEDLVQEVLVKAFVAYPKFRHESSVRSWLFQILRNEISSFCRKKKKEQIAISESQVSEEPVLLSELLRPKVTNEEFTLAVERDEFWTMIQSCFQKMPEHLLEIFLCRLSNPERKVDSLCEELELSPSNFSVRLFRARLLLRKCVEKTWV